MCIFVDVTKKKKILWEKMPKHLGKKNPKTAVHILQ